MAIPHVEEAWPRHQLLERRRQLEAIESTPAAAKEVASLLREVDAALARLGAGTFGICKTCHDPIEADRLLVDPLIEYCIDHLTETERRRLEQDLELAAHIQGALLPRPGLRAAGWEVHHRYRPAGPVSGDYCDAISPKADSSALFFVIADVAGKGVAASLLMAHLSAAFRTLADEVPPVTELVERMNRVFCESVPAAQYATLVCGRAAPDGDMELCNAGHPSPLWSRRGGVAKLPATGVPIGLFCSATYSSEKMRLDFGDSVVLHTDGLSEARNRKDEEYGQERLTRVLTQNRSLPPGELADACLADLGSFVVGAPLKDDLTLMVVRRTSAV